MHFEYENLVALFEQALLTELRGHGSGGEFLRSWVPDTDVTKSLINMADAAALENVPAFEVGLSAQAAPALNLPELTEALAETFQVTRSEAAGGQVQIKFVSAGT